MQYLNNTFFYAATLHLTVRLYLCRQAIVISLGSLSHLFGG